MIKEEYVNFETAKLLKEKGFDGVCYKVWQSIKYEGQFLTCAPVFVEGETTVTRETVDAAVKLRVYEYDLEDGMEEGYLAPSQSLAMRWLREKFGIHIIINHDSCDEYWYWQAVDVKDKDENWDGKFALTEEYGGFSTYEETAEKAIKYCLEELLS